MYERVLSESERYLQRKGRGEMSVKELWIVMSQDGIRNSFAVPNLADYNCLLEGDERFEFIIEENDAERSESELIDYDQMEKLGFLGKHQIRLRKKKNPSDDPDGDAVEDEIADTGDDQLLDRELLAQHPTAVHIKKEIVSKQTKKSTPKSAALSRMGKKGKKVLTKNTSRTKAPLSKKRKK